MFKTILGLCQAALLVGMTGFAPYVAGRCALGASGMPGMAMHAGMPMGGHTPTSPHAHHGCCGCLGPCAGNGLAALPASVALFVTAPLPAPVSPKATRRPDEPVRHLLPFANGPPSHLG